MSTLVPRLLVVGHDPESGAVADAIAASEFDHDVVTVANREAAVRTIERQRIDCVITGYEVPDEAGRTYMGGLRLLEAVREAHGDLPVIVFTHVVNEDSLRLAAANGVRAYVRDQPGEDVVGQLRYHVDSAARGRLAERRAAGQDRINRLMRGVTQTLVLEEDREAMLAALCTELTGQDVYRYAAYHERTEGAIEAEPESAAGTATGGDAPMGLLRRCVDGGAVETDRLGGDAEAATDDHPRALHCVAVPIVYEGEYFGALVLETDPEHTFFEQETAVLAELGEAIGHALNAVETREALQEREAALERRTEQLEGFASLVSHDVRNPLNVAQGYVELLDERVDDDAIDEIAASLDRIEAIVADILALTRADQELTTVPTDLGTVVADAWDSVDTPNATLETGSLPRVEADASQLQRVFENLFRNAVEHGSTSPDSQARRDAVEHGSTSPPSTSSQEDSIEHGTPEERPDDAGADATGLTVRVAFEDGELVVEDDGVGFPADVADGLFELGESGSASGTGIGLSIVRDLLEAHGWSVRAENREAGGARFRIGGVDPIE